jgi:hypothetical protein
MSSLVFFGAVRYRSPMAFTNSSLVAALIFDIARARAA